MATDDRLEKIMSQTKNWINEFEKDRLYIQLTDEQQEETNRIIETYIEAMYIEQDRTLGKWTQKDTVLVVSEYFPNKITGSISFYKAVVPVLMNFFSYLESIGRLKNAPTLIKGLEKSEAKLTENATLSGATKIPQKSEKPIEGIPDKTIVDEPRSMYRLQNKVTKTSKKTQQRRVEKIGRNEPCPCGSGKKYKKCHGK